MPWRPEERALTWSRVVQLAPAFVVFITELPTMARHSPGGRQMICCVPSSVPGARRLLQ
jgi:hypothetical protein